MSIGICTVLLIPKSVATTPIRWNKVIGGNFGSYFLTFVSNTILLSFLLFCRGSIFYISKDAFTCV